MKDTIFCFNFCSQNTDTDVYKVFLIKNYNYQNNFVTYSLMYDCERTIHPEIGLYGYHEPIEVDNSESLNIIQFASYEVDEALYDELMNKWREYFSFIVGEENVSQVFTFLNEDEVYSHFLS